ncbi:gamma-mobile-trio protein GmtX [Vibrio harveyi]|uniref:gamma-mobile-trio protein GmtX n=1 Tax=Vibrio harveyi TaxID=669 RepID=UPI0018F209E8|nr:gamma-mobile-trio protein GmtX [Vibrio harveyi]
MSSELLEIKDDKLRKEIEAIYQALRTECKTARSKNSIDIVNKTCAEIAQGSRDFSTSIVGNLANAKGGPSAQSISNKNGKRYRDLINAYQRAYPLPTKLTTPNTNYWIDQIQQPGVKGNVLIMQSELRKLRDENKVLRNLLANKNDLVVTLTQSSPQSDNSFTHLTETDYESLKSAIDAERLKVFGLRLAEGGSIENENGAEVFEIGFADAIEKIITLDRHKNE